MLTGIIKWSIFVFLNIFMAKPPFDKFYKHTVYPDALQVFNLSLSPIEALKDEAIFVFDTNALIVPYTSSAESLEKIKTVLQVLKAKKQLILPGQVVREFAGIRPQKLGEIFQAIERKRNAQAPSFLDKYPLLHQMDCYQEMQQIEKTINEQLKAYNKALDVLLKTVRGWNWNDPVSLIYRDIFSADIIVDTEFDKAKVIEDMEYRFMHSIPPGYEDSGKADGGIGDLLIWLTIIEIGRTEKKPVIFVSGDQKKDWFHQSEKKGIYPRFELVTEFQRESGGCDFHMIKLSELLALMGAEPSIVNDIASEELRTPAMRVATFAELSEECVLDWYIAQNKGATIYQSQSMYDFELDLPSGRSAIEVISYTSADYESFSQKLIPILQRFDKSRFAELHIVFVHSNIKQLDDIAEITMHVINRIMHDDFPIKLIFGHVTWDEKFVPLKTINPYQ